ncbi:MAG: cytidine/deoxycytidylate deaminase family protein [Desulfobacula sp.]|nr:cytidine/deoxycytidylate deaminase family protein [Desulfobacula sp.]
MTTDFSKRPSWNQYFMGITDLVSSRSTCLRRKVGAIIVKDRRILCSGYNGAPSKVPHCSETGCLREKLKVPSGEKHELCRGVHAEQNAIIQAAFHGIKVSGAVLYCTNQPCSICAKMIINAGIKKVYYRDGYDDALGLEMFDQAKVELIQLGIDSV